MTQTIFKGTQELPCGAMPCISLVQWGEVALLLPEGIS